jgi:hypothetical protein
MLSRFATHRVDSPCRLPLRKITKLTEQLELSFGDVTRFQFGAAELLADELDGIALLDLSPGRRSALGPFPLTLFSLSRQYATE